MPTDGNEFTLGLFDHTALSGWASHAPQVSPIAYEDDPSGGADADTISPLLASGAVSHGINYQLVGDRDLARGWPARARDNIAAILLSKELEQTGRIPTLAEQAQLLRFTGFGATELAQHCFRLPGEESFRPGWEEIGAALEAAVTSAEYAALQRATQYAHYTPEAIIRALWRAVERLGFHGGRVLEPGMGTGLFFALLPEALRPRCHLTGIEYDPVTARIARLVHPEARVRREDYARSHLGGGFDLAIGNPPFADRVVRADPTTRARRLRLHDYFIARSIARLRPGGIALFVTSTGTMDKASTAAREYIADMADLVGAVRLPEGSMRASAGTDVVIDVLVFQRRAEGQQSAGAAWIDLASVQCVTADDNDANDSEESDRATVAVNRYFVEHPEMVLDEHALRRGIYGPGLIYPLLGAGQLIFSDLGTIGVEATRGFSAYRWIKQQLVLRGVPAGQVAFIQDYRRSADKQRVFADFRAGRVRILIGSSDTMGTGANVQQRLKALHHLDVPWLPSQIEQREGRIERQGNQHEEIEIYAYATLGSMDATMWQNNERKARFIEAALSGDRSIRRIEDAGSQANQFAMAKAIASGDSRLMQEAALESEVARLQRQRAAHIDDQHAIRRQIHEARREQAHAEARVRAITADLARWVPTRGDQFAMEVEGRTMTQRRAADAALLTKGRLAAREGVCRSWTVGRIGGFDVTCTVRETWPDQRPAPALTLLRTDFAQPIDIDRETTPAGIIARLEHILDRMEIERDGQRRRGGEAATRLTGYEPRLGETFPLQGELDERLARLAEIEADLARTESVTGETAEPQRRAA